MDLPEAVVLHIFFAAAMAAKVASLLNAAGIAPSGHPDTRQSGSRWLRCARGHEFLQRIEVCDLGSPMVQGKVPNSRPASGGEHTFIDGPGAALPGMVRLNSGTMRVGIDTLAG